jgi:L-threonine-O-3-phosphate decarboxylase
VKQPVDRPLHGGNLVWAASLASCSPSSILDFSASINPLGPPQSAISALQAHLQALKSYPDPQYRQLRTALSELHRLSPDWVLPGNGVAELLTWACRDLAELDFTCLLTPAFGDYLRALKAFNAKVLEYPISFLNEKPEALSHGRVKEFLPPILDCSSNAQAKGLLLNNPHNPTGMLFSAESLLLYLQHFALVIVDEAFMDFLPPDEQQSVIDAVQDYPNLVVLRSLTKFYSLPGLRLGYAIGHPERLQRWQQWRDPWSVNTLAAAVGEVIVRDAAFQQQTWDWLATAKPQLYQGLANLPEITPYSGAANFLLVQSECSVVELQAELLRRYQILIRDCLSFSGLGDRYFRVAIRFKDENQRLLDGLAQILAEQV